MHASMIIVINIAISFFIGVKEVTYQTHLMLYYHVTSRDL